MADDATAVAVVLVARLVPVVAGAPVGPLVPLAGVTSGRGVRRLVGVLSATRGVRLLARVVPVTRGVRRIRAALAVPIPSPLPAAGMTAPAAAALRGAPVATSAV